MQSLSSTLNALECCVGSLEGKEKSLPFFNLGTRKIERTSQYHTNHIEDANMLLENFIVNSGDMEKNTVDFETTMWYIVDKLPQSNRHEQTLFMEKMKRMYIRNSDFIIVDDLMNNIFLNPRYQYRIKLNLVNTFTRN